MHTFINGECTSAVVYTVADPRIQIDTWARSQIAALCNNEAFRGSRIRVMPDVHAGKVCPIGFTATLGDRVMPVLTGADIGCGISMVRIVKGKPDWIRLDRVIRECVPSGFDIRKKPSVFADSWNHDELRAARHIRKDRALLSLGTLGGGNHFIEAGSDGESLFLAVHSGSRQPGREITEHYLDEGQKILREAGITVPRELTWLTGELRDNWLYDTALAQKYAELNRAVIIREILRGMKWKAEEILSCAHNCVTKGPEPGSLILRKGAISARAGEKVLIPVSMKEGILTGTGIGNPEWNSSAPHGSGRIIPRSEVKNFCTVNGFKKEMRGIHSTCIHAGTLDESPAAYRTMDAIREAVTETVTVTGVIRPLYSFKAGNAE